MKNWLGEWGLVWKFRDEMNVETRVATDEKWYDSDFSNCLLGWFHVVSGGVGMEFGAHRSNAVES